MNLYVLDSSVEAARRPNARRSRDTKETETLPQEGATYGQLCVFIILFLIAQFNSLTGTGLLHNIFCDPSTEASIYNLLSKNLLIKP